MNYEFDLTKMSVLDYININMYTSTNNIGGLLRVINKFTDFDVMQLDAKEISKVIDAFALELLAHFEQGGVSVEEKEEKVDLDDIWKEW